MRGTRASSTQRGDRTRTTHQRVLMRGTSDEALSTVDVKHGARYEAVVH